MLNQCLSLDANWETSAPETKCDIVGPAEGEVTAVMGVGLSCYTAGQGQGGRNQDQLAWVLRNHGY